jgi:hypothetical protein
MVRTANIRRHVPRRSGGGGGTTLKGPDGVKNVSRKRVFDPFEYDAAGSDRIEYATYVTSAGTTTVSTKTAAGAARDHDFAVNQYVAIFGAGAAAAVIAPPVTGTNASLTNFGSAVTFTGAAATDILTTNVAFPGQNGDEVQLTTTGTLVGDLTPSFSYFIRRVTNDRRQWQLYDTAPHAIAGGPTGLIDVTATPGSGVHTMVPWTLQTYAFACGGGNGDFSPASATLSIRTANVPPGVTTHGVEIRCPLSWGATSVIVYGRGAANRQALVHLDACLPFDLGGFIANNGTTGRFTSVATNSGGARSQLLGTGGTATHGIVAGDWILIRASSSGDTEYDVRAEVITVNADDMIIEHPFSDTAAGGFRPAFVKYRDYGRMQPLHATTYLPSMGNADLNWTAGRAYSEGAVCFDPTNKLFYRCIRATGTRLSGSSAPTWPTAATGVVADNELVWKIDLAMYPVDEPSTATPQCLLARIAAVPTTSTFTTTVAASAPDLAAVKLVVTHNDAIPIRDTVAAARAYGRNATIAPGAGTFPCYMPKQTNTAFWTNDTAVNTSRHFFIYLASGTTGLAHPKLNIVCDPGATFLVRMMQNHIIPEDLVVGGNTFCGPSVFINQSTDNATIAGGEWLCDPSCGGWSEVGAGSYRNSNAWIGGWTFLQSGGVAAINTTFRDVMVRWPTIGSPAAVTEGSRMKSSRHKWLNCTFHYGCSDGDFTFNPYGRCQIVGGQFRGHSRFSSVGLYPGADVERVQITGVLIEDAQKLAFQARAEGGNSFTAKVIFENVIVKHSGPILIGDVTSSNREFNVDLVNVQGASLSLAECRGVRVVGGQYATLDIREDCVGIHITGAAIDDLICNPSDLARGVHVSGCEIENAFQVGNTYDSVFNDISLRDAAPRGTSLIGGTYESVAVTGLTDVYRFKLRGVDYDPLFTAPTARSTVVRIRENKKFAVTTAGEVASMNLITDDTWYFGNTEIQQVVHSGTPTGGSFTYSWGTPTGAITNTTGSPATAATVQTAIRALGGSLAAAVVTESGSGTNKTFTIYFSGYVGDPPQVIVDVTGQTGGAAVATPSTVHAYPGYETYVVKIGDSLARDPDDNPIGTVSFGLLTGYAQDLYLDNVLENVTFRDLSIKRTVQAGSLIGYPAVTTNKFGSGTLRTKNVVFENPLFEDLGCPSGLVWYAFDMTTGSMLDCDIRVKGGRIVNGINSTSHHPLRANFVNGGKFIFDGVDFTAFNGGAGTYTNALGNVDVLRCRMLTNRIHITPDAATEQWNINTALSDGGADDGLTYHPIVLELGLGNAYPVTSPQVTGSTRYWWNTTTKKLYPTESDANLDTNAITITSVASTNACLFKVCDFARLGVGGFGALGFSASDAWGVVKDSLYRDSEAVLFADPGSDQNNYSVRRFKVVKANNAAARNYTGFDAPAGGTAEHEFIWENNGGFDCTFAHASGSSSAENQFTLPGAATLTIPALGRGYFWYDLQITKWRGCLIG